MCPLWSLLLLLLQSCEILRKPLIIIFSQGDTWESLFWEAAFSASILPPRKMARDFLQRITSKIIRNLPPYRSHPHSSECTDMEMNLSLSGSLGKKKAPKLNGMGEVAQGPLPECQS